MNRRKLMMAMSAAAMTPLVPAVTRAADISVVPANRKPPPFDLLIQPATDCLVKGQTCLSHCIYLVGEGQKEMALVARNVNELLALCTSVQSLAIQHGRQLGGLVPLAIAAAEATEAECRKHQQHIQCRDCADACTALIKAGKQFQVEFAEFQRSAATG